ncbi:MAG: phytoene/squalene synthase family protein [Candidatus Sericytochromatia bacterium]
MTIALTGRLAARADGRACRTVIRRHSKSFYLSAMLLPPSVREAAFAIYAFCRHADDAVDAVSAHQSPLVAVERLRRRLDAVYRGAALDQPVDRAFALVVDRYGIPAAVPESLLDGMEMDARGARYETEHDLLGYAFRVASSVGLMMTRVMGPSGDAAYLRAADLGVAMQLTNIARDVGEDARMGRCYLPSELLDAVGLRRERLTEPTADAAARAAVRHLLDLADRHYAAADAGIGYLPASCRLAITSARLIYADIGTAIARQGHDTLAARAFVPLGRKLQLVGQAVGRLSLPADPGHRGPNDDALAAMIRGVGLPAEAAA